ncbi:MAG: Calcineurin-like phosphoesterase, partial [Verrucomicrobiaceae bacterium]|nr:Calcineurin-like phosphoesterase [Verrucomicrobiaceae bacterium]
FFNMRLLVQKVNEPQVPARSCKSKLWSALTSLSGHFRPSPSIMKAIFACLTLLLADLAHAAETTLPLLPEGAFTIAVIPDTQGYKGMATKAQPDSKDPLTNAVFAHHTAFIKDHLKDQNIVFVSHVGDIVDIDVWAQWKLARENIDVFHGLVPYGLCVGNHDMKNDGNASLFQHYFPSERFKEFPWYGGTFESANEEDQKKYGNNVNSYQLVTAAGMNFVFIHLECNAPDPVLDWAGGILDRYADRRACISTHMDLGVILSPKTQQGFSQDPQGRMLWSKVHKKQGNTPQQMWDKLYRKHANLGIVFSGDQSRVTSLHLTDTGDHGNIVHRLLSDYTSSGPMRLYRFLPADNKVQVITWDTTANALTETSLYKAGREYHQFEFDYDMRQKKLVQP